MLKKTALALLLALTLLPAAAFAQVHITVAPPAPIVERRPPPPDPHYVWQPGYHHWERDHYVWTPGVWVAPPHEHAVWVPHHWVHRHGEWILIEGHWR